MDYKSQTALYVLFLLGLINACTGATISFDVTWYDGRNQSYQFEHEDYSDCLFSRDPDVMQCMNKYRYSDIASVWKYNSSAISYIAVNCLSQRHFQTHQHTCLCTRASDAANPTISRKHDIFNYCQVYRLLPRVFRNLNNLKVIDLQNNSISTVEIDAFKGTSSMQYLDLSLNPFDSLPGSVMCDSTRLEVLLIKKSLLSTFPAQIFDCQGPSGLSFIDISEGLINSLPPNSFKYLPNLKSLNLSGNDVESIYPPTFEPIKHLEFIDLSFNKFFEFPSGLCDAKENLDHVKLNGNKMQHLNFSSMHECQSVRHFDLSDNLIKTLSADVLNNSTNDSFSLTHLHLRSNALQDIPPRAFGHFKQLEFLDLSNNNLGTMHNETFLGLDSLRHLRLTENSITIEDTPHTSYFLHHTRNLTELYLDSNAIKTVPEGMFEKLTQLEHLDLSRNQISNEMTQSFKMLISLKRLVLSHNLISSVPRLFFASMLSLESVDLSYNQIVSLDCLLPLSLTQINIHHNALTEFPKSLATSRVKTLDLRMNSISSLRAGRMGTVTALTSLDLSDNVITIVEEGCFRHLANLSTLSLNNNKLNLSFSNSFIFMGLENLKYLDLSSNKLSDVDGLLNSGQLPNLQTLILNHNNIPTVSHLCSDTDPGNKTGHLNMKTISLVDSGIESIEKNAFQCMPNLFRVNLQENKIQTFVPFNVSWSTEFFLAGNPLICSCAMEWLKKDYIEMGTRQLSTYKYHVTYCDVIAHGYTMALHRVPEKDFLCDTKQECDSPCSCYSRVPNGPVQTTKCSGGLSTVPAFISTWSKFIYLDGNNMNHVTKDVTRGVEMMTIELYMNVSGIEDIGQDFFHNFVNLEVLDLSINKLTEIKPLQFKYQTRLKSLNLSSNFISVIGEGAFSGLRNLLRLDLSNNEIQVIDSRAVGQMSVFHVAFLVYLKDNPLTCTCSNEDFRKWVTVYRSRIGDKRSLFCRRDNGQRQYLSYYAKSFCEPAVAPAVTSDNFSRNVVITCVILSVMAAFVLAVLYYYRRDIVAILFVKFGCGCLRTKFDDSRLYDAFVVYDTKDSVSATWTSDNLIHRLQMVKRPRSYRLIAPENTKLQERIREMESHQVYDCKTAVFIVTPSFSGNNWAIECFRKATSFRQENNLFKIILVTLGRIRWEFVEPEMRSMFQKGQYIPARSRTALSRLIYELPDPDVHGGVAIDDALSETDVIIYDVAGESDDDPGRVYIN